MHPVKHDSWQDYILLGAFVGWCIDCKNVHVVGNKFVSVFATCFGFSEKQSAGN